MKILKNRPLATACLVFALTQLLTFFLGTPWKWGLLCLLSFLFLAILILRRRRRFLLLLCIGFSILALLSCYYLFDLPMQRVRNYMGRTVVVEGTVLSREESTAYSTTFRVKLDRVEEEELSVYAIVKATYASPLQSGDCFSLMAKAKDFEKEGDYDEEVFYLSQGNSFVLLSDKREWESKTGEDPHMPLVWLSRLNLRLSHRLYTAVGDEAGALSAALLLGNRSFLSRETVLQFRRTGVSHLLALSGLHVSILIAFLELLLRKLLIPKPARGILVPLTAIGYLCLTGFSLSTVRSVLMVCVLYFAFFLWSEYDSFTAVCTALFVILLVTPYAVLDLSLWMSFLAAASIIIFSPAFADLPDRLGKRMRLPGRGISLLRRVLTAFLVGFFANVALLLLTAVVYGEISLTSVPATMLLAIPISLLLPLSAVSLAFPLIAPICGLCARGVLWLNSNISDLRGILLPAEDLPTVLILCAMTLVLLLFAFGSMKRRVAMLLLPGLLLLAIGSSFFVTKLNCQRLEVQVAQNYGGETILYAQGGRAVAVDLSNGLATSSSQIRDAARESRCTELEELILTRYYGRSPFLISSLAGQIRIHTLRLPEPLNDTECAVARRLEEEAASFGIEVRYDTEELGLETLEVLCAFHTPMTDNKASEVLFTVRADGEIMTSLNASLLDGEHRSFAVNGVASADVLLVAKRSRGEMDFAMNRDVRLVILGAPEILPAVRGRFEGAEILLLEEAYSFFLK